MTVAQKFKLSEVCVQDRRSIKAGECDNLRYIGMETIEPNTGAFVGGDLSKTPEAPRANSFYFTERHVLYGKLRPYLNKVALPDFEGKCSTEIIPLLPSDSLDRDYLAYFLRSAYTVSRISAKTVGARMPRADMNSVLALEIPLPSVAEQRHIIDILKRADGIRRLRKQAQDTARQLIPALFIDMFGDPATNPKGWRVVGLGQLITSGPQNGLYKHASSYGDGTPILRIDGFYDGVVTDLSALRRLNITDEEAGKYKLREHDIVINRVNSPEYLGKSALIENLVEDTVFESNMMRFSVDDSQLDPRFLIYHLQLPAVKCQILSKAKHAINQSSINQGDVKSLSLVVPPIDLQKQFLTRTDSVLSIAVQQEAAQEYAESNFQSLLYRAFNGAILSE